MADEADKRCIFNAAILIMRGNNWTLEANAFVAVSHDDARMKALRWAKEKHPDAEGYNGSSGYHVHTCILTDENFISELVELAREILELKTYSEPTFKPPESDEVQ
jgi:hypothetical protein